MEIDAIVTDRQGRFVPGLTKDDFQVIEEGKPQQISTFSSVSIPVDVDRADSRIARREPIEPDAVSNREPFNGRIFLLLLDDLQTGISRTPFVRQAARAFVERHMAANDVVAASSRRRLPVKSCPADLPSRRRRFRDGGRTRRSRSSSSWTPRR